MLRNFKAKVIMVLVVVTVSPAILMIVANSPLLLVSGALAAGWLIRGRVQGKPAQRAVSRAAQRSVRRSVQRLAR